MNDTTSIAWLGLDAHSKNCVLGQLDDHGAQIKWWSFPTRPQQLIQHVQAIPATVKHLMLEESNLARWIGQLLKPRSGIFTSFPCATPVPPCAAEHPTQNPAHSVEPLADRRGI